MTKQDEGYPEMKAPEAQPKSGTKRPFHVAAAHLPRHIAAGIRTLKRWDDLFDVTDEEVAAAVNDFQSIKIGG